jgi:acetylornithine deacetylase
LEPTDLTLYAANRGAIWFQIDIEGRSTHMGRKWEGVNAVELGCEVIGKLADYEQRLLAASRNQPLFEDYEVPVQVNVGTMNGGSWPAMVADHCRIEGGVGFLPNKHREIIRTELREALDEIDNPWLRSHLSLRFERLKNEAFATPLDARVVCAMRQALDATGLDGTPRGWNVSCDARLYATVGSMPVVVFGAGDIRHAHGKDEQIDLDSIYRGHETLVHFVQTWNKEDVS